MNADLQDIKLIISRAKTIGIGITSADSEAYIVNLGDDLFIFDSYPHEELLGEDIEIEKIAM